MVRLDFAPNDWHDIISFIQSRPVNKSIWSIVQRLVLGASVYYTWQERNLRIFLGKNRSASDSSKLIMEVVRLRLLSFKLRPSRQVFEAADIWEFHVQKGHKELLEKRKLCSLMTGRKAYGVADGVDVMEMEGMVVDELGAWKLALTDMGAGSLLSVLLLGIFMKTLLKIWMLRSVKCNKRRPLFVKKSNDLKKVKFVNGRSRRLAGPKTMNKQLEHLGGCPNGEPKSISHWSSFFYLLELSSSHLPCSHI
ncbi:hypothetical protein Tco_1072256 [Tanacetum coccineum]